MAASFDTGGYLQVLKEPVDTSQDEVEYDKPL